MGLYSDKHLAFWIAISCLSVDIIYSLQDNCYVTFPKMLNKKHKHHYYIVCITPSRQHCLTQMVSVHFSTISDCS